MKLVSPTAVKRTFLVEIDEEELLELFWGLKSMSPLRNEINLILSDG